MIGTIIVAIVGFFAGWKVREAVAVYKLTKLLSTPKQEPNTLIDLRVNIEKHKDVFYLYNEETKQFLVQGKTKDECIQFFQKAFPNNRIVADADNIKEVDFK